MIMKPIGMKSLTAVLACCLGTSVSAGCANFTDGSIRNTPPPRYRICYDEVCDITTQDYICSNVDSIQTGYAIGWTLDCRIADGREQDCIISWQGRAIDPAKHDRLTFTEITQ